MCNLSEWVLETGWKKGMAEGKELGMAEGKELGMAEGKELGMAEGKELGMESIVKRMLLLKTNDVISHTMSPVNIYYIKQDSFLAQQFFAILACCCGELSLSDSSGATDVHLFYPHRRLPPGHCPFVSPLNIKVIKKNFTK